MYENIGTALGRNNIVWGNMALNSPNVPASSNFSYSCIEGGLTGTGNIDEDPMFTDPDEGDYTLQADSPCIDAGDPLSPLDPDNTVADIGAFFYDQGSGVNDDPETLKPIAFSLSGAYPNPFNPTTAISYQLSALSFVNLTVYDVQGRMVAELVNGWRNAGVHEVIFNASGLASGIYLYQMITGDHTANGKMVLMK